MLSFGESIAGVLYSTRSTIQPIHLHFYAKIMVLFSGFPRLQNNGMKSTLFILHLRIGMCITILCSSRIPHLNALPLNPWQCRANYAKFDDTITEWQSCGNSSSQHYCKFITALHFPALSLLLSLSRLIHLHHLFLTLNGFLFACLRTLACIHY